MLHPATCHCCWNHSTVTDRRLIFCRSDCAEPWRTRPLSDSVQDPFTLSATLQRKTPLPRRTLSRRSPCQLMRQRPMRPTGYAFCPIRAHRTLALAWWRMSQQQMQLQGSARSVHGLACVATPQAGLMATVAAPTASSLCFRARKSWIFECCVIARSSKRS